MPQKARDSPAPEPRRARFSDLVVSSLNQDNPLIWPESIPAWLRPTVIRRVAIATNDESPGDSEQFHASQRALSPSVTEMNPGSTDTFRNSRVTGPLSDHSLSGGRLPVHRPDRHIVPTSSNPYFVDIGSRSETSQVPSGSYLVTPFRFSTSSSSRIKVTQLPVYDKLTGSQDWILQLGVKLVNKTICKAVGPGGSYRKRMARLRYGFRKIAPKLKLPYCLMRDILGSSLLAVKRATTMSSNTDEMIRALREAS
jgi:hypothetical protein